MGIIDRGIIDGGIINMNDLEVLLINPVDNTAVKEGLGLTVPPLNLMYLGAALEKNSIKVKIHDDDLYQLGFENINRLISKMDPMIIGITATTATIQTSINYIRTIKKDFPHILTIIGGPHTTFTPKETLYREKSLDIVVMGEGEETLVDVVKQYIKNGTKEFSNVKGIVYRDNNKVIMTEPRPLIEDLDSLPFPARHLIPFKSYELSSQAGGMITSRGCVFSCDYCSSSLIMGKKFRTRSPENVVDEVEELACKYGIKDIAFLDDIFMLNKKRAGQIADEIKSRDIDVDFIASSRVDMIDKSLLETLKKSGMKTLYCGVESGSQRVLDLMKKGITVQQAKDAFKTAKRVGVDIVGSFILGYPGETSEEMDKTIDLSIELDPDYSQYSILTPFPGTGIHYQLKEKGLLSKNGWEDYTVLKSVINYELLGLSKKLVERKLIKAYLKFYTRPSYLFKHRSMFNVLIKTILRSFIVPKKESKTPKGWYDILK
ncbi:tRNA-2-methylthio-N(6)-dimethylallyladenosine synthase [Methanobrevibacter cuticularis]|uniref:tRNA-2-methylthio-N(6)-dimethylallyladenosine synthase n=1 Tax=Methanobrevibacter cuticularis TaxID=47311 RepID=A0A166CUA0_9EURY|nr:radical SAM protein [Methanobrevibacter cuticularis]KZX16867.1 tRNA-2-methylthio-N(6)-dimethylallyladenosine synthase [Methanobrevibacter cuticularis]